MVCCFYWVQVLYHGVQRNNWLWLYQPQKQNLYRLLFMLVKEYGWGEFYRNWGILTRITQLVCVTIKLFENLVMHDQSKHIDVRFHFLRSLTKGSIIKLIHCKNFRASGWYNDYTVEGWCFSKVLKLLGACDIDDIN